MSEEMFGPQGEDVPSPEVQMAMGMLFGQCMEMLNETTNRIHIVADTMQDPIAAVTFETLHNLQVVLQRTMERLEDNENITVKESPLGEWALMIKQFVESHGGHGCPCVPSEKDVPLSDENIQSGIAALEDLINEPKEE